MNDAQNSPIDPDMEADYDFSQGVQGKYAHRFVQGSNIIVLAPDVAAVFSDSAAVNDALRTLITVARQTVPPAAHRPE